MRYRYLLSLLALALSASLPALSQHDVNVEIEGLDAFVALNYNGTDKADEVRAVLVDSTYRGNPSQHKTLHVPTIEFLDGTIGTAQCRDSGGHCNQPITPHFRRRVRVGGSYEDWQGWYLHDTQVMFEGSSGAVTTVDYDKICSLSTIHGKSKLGRAADGVWEGIDPDGRVSARIHLSGGTLAAKNVIKQVEVGGNKSDVATRVDWTAKTITAVTLSQLGTGSGTLWVPLTANNRVRVLNVPATLPPDALTAYHFPSFYKLTKKVFLPTPVIPTRPPPATSDAFCPPINLGRP